MTGALSLALLLAAQPPTLERYRYHMEGTFSSAKDEIVLSSNSRFTLWIYDPWARYYPGENIGHGYAEFTDPEDPAERILIPAYAVNVVNIIEAAKTYFDAAGLPTNYITSSNRENVEITDLATSRGPNGSNADGTLGVTNLLTGTIEIDRGLGWEDLATVPIHEYFHVVQATLYGSYELVSSYAYKLAVESTAEWASDEPVPLNLVNVPARSPARQWRTADDADGYRHRRWSLFANHLAQSFFRRTSSRDEYCGVFFFKYFAEQAGPSETAAVHDFWTRLSGHSYRSEEDVISSVSRTLRDRGAFTGGSGEIFQRFYARWAAASVVYRYRPSHRPAGILGYRDFASAQRAGGYDQTGLVLNRPAHYSGASRPRIQESVARDDDEIRRRLEEIAVSHTLQERYSQFTDVYLGPSDTMAASQAGNGWRTNNWADEGARMFLYAASDSSDPLAAQVLVVSQTDGDWWGRPDEARSTLHTEFELAPGGAGGRCSDWMRIDNVAFQPRPDLRGRVTQVFVTQVNTGAEAHAFQTAYAFTPDFQHAYTQNPGPIDTETVKFVRSRPEREPDEGFMPGDEVTFEVDLSDIVHQGSSSDIGASNRTLEVVVHTDSHSEVRVEDLRVSCPDTTSCRYQVTFTIPTDNAHFDRAHAHMTVRSFLKLGDQDRNEDDTFLFQIVRDPPEVSSVWLRREHEVFYNSSGTRFRPITPGPVEIEIGFDQGMNRETGTAISLDQTRIQGAWRDDRTWRGTFDVPSGVAFANWKGWRTIWIRAQGANGVALEGDDDRPDDQADTTHRVLVDGAPPIARSIHVLGGGNSIYRAEWAGMDETATVENYTLAALRDRSRTLNVSEQRDAPATGAGGIYIDFTQPLDRAPTVTIGGHAIAMEMVGQEKAWSGTFVWEDVQRGNEGRPLPVVIEAVDRYGNRLDGDPRTVAAVQPEGIPWARYEDNRGGSDTGAGGPDRWHEIGTPAAVSLVIILDASGSMGEEGRMETAKQGIRTLLDNLPENVELAIVVFFDCENIQSVGFTRDVARIRAAVESASPNSATPLAAAIARARSLLQTAAHPGSYDWRYAVFSDGQETCDGDVAAELRELDRVIAERAGAEPPEPEEPDAPPPPQPADAVEIHPEAWTVYRVRVRFGNLHLDTIWLDEIEFAERPLPDGRGILTLTTRTFGVHYGQLRGEGRRTRAFGINSRPSRNETRTATSGMGRAAVEALRAEAQALRAGGVTRDAARAEIDRAVNECLDRVGND